MIDYIFYGLYALLFLVGLFYDFIFPYYLFRKGDIINIGSSGSQCRVVKVKKATHGTITVTVEPFKDKGKRFNITMDNR